MRAIPPALRGVTSFLYRLKCVVSGMITVRQGLLASSQLGNCSAAGIEVKVNSRQTVVSLVGVSRFLGGIHIFLPKPELAWVDILLAIYLNTRKLH